MKTVKIATLFSQTLKRAAGLLYRQLLHRLLHRRCIDCIDNGQKCEVSGAVMRYIVTGGILLATLGWLVLSYLPESTAALPQVAFTGALAQSALPWLAGATLLVFLAIQTDLVRATARWFGPAATPATVRAAREFNLQRGIETFWTVLPLLGTLLLGFWLVIVG